MSKRSNQPRPRSGRSPTAGVASGEYGRQRATSADSDDRMEWLTRAALVIVVVVTIARLLMTETARTHGLTSKTPEPVGPGPAAGLVLDFLSGIGPLLVLLRRMLDPSFKLRFSVPSFLLLLAGVLAVSSTFWAGDKFLSTVSGCHLLAASGVLWTVVQIVRSRRHVKVIAGVCVGLLAVLVAHGLWFIALDRPPLIESYRKDPNAALASRGIEPGSFSAIQFENKVLHGELMGFSVSPNTYAALLVLLGLVTIGTAAHLIRHRRWLAASVPVMLLACAAGVLPLTQSRTSFVTSGLGVAMLSAFALIGPAVRRWRRPLLWLAGAAVLAAAAFVIGYGVSRGTLFQDSLNFRWRYWTGSFRMWLKHPLIGVGWENFGPHYLSARSPEATEEIVDPHNFVVRFFTELGAVGGLLILAWAVLTLVSVTRPRSTSAAHPGEPADRAPTNLPAPATQFPLSLVGGLSFLGAIVGFLAAIDLTVDSAYGTWECIRFTFYGGLLCLAAMIVAGKDEVPPDQDVTPTGGGETTGAIRVGMIVAVAMFLLHNLIDFAWFEFGPMFLFSLVLGTALARAFPDVSEADDTAAGPLAVRRQRRTARTVFATAAGLWLIFGIAVVIPVGTSESIAREADEALRLDHPSVAAKGYESAFQNTVHNPDYALRAALAHAAAAEPVPARAAADQAVEAGPFYAPTFMTRAEIDLQLSPPDAVKAMQDFEAALQLDPNNVSYRLRFADFLQTVGKPSQAVEQLQTALNLNDRLTAVERKRLPARRVQEIEAKIRALSQQ